MRHIPIAELADWLHASGNPWKAMALLKAYFDESGTDEKLAVVGYAGFCANEKQWSRIEVEWKQALSDFGIDWFHMVDLVHSRGHMNFGPMREEILARFSKGLKGRVDENRLVPIWSAVEKAAWDEADKPAAFIQQFPKPLDLSFDHIVHQLRRFSRLYARETPIVPMFADGSEYTDRNKAVYETYKRHPAWGNFLGPIAFGSPRQVVALQPSDMLAYEITTHFDRLELDYFERIRGLNYRPVVDDITKIIDLNMSGCVGSDALRVILRKFAAGQPLWD